MTKLPPAQAARIDCTTAGFGGTVLIEAGGNLSVQGDLRAVSQSGSGGVVSLSSQAAMNVSGIIDVSATGLVNASSRASGQNNAAGAIAVKISDDAQTPF